MLIKDVFVRAPASKPLEEHTVTLYENFNRGLQISRHSNYLGTRQMLPNGQYGPYKWLTYEDVNELRTIIGSSLIKLSKNINANYKLAFHKIGIYSVNRKEWIITEQACSAYSLVVVPICKN